MNQRQQPYRYTTYERDGDGVDQALMRSYHGWWTRFDEPDPWEGSYDLSDPQSFNRYAYVRNDPVNFVDPSGLFALNREYFEAMEALWELWLFGMQMNQRLMQPLVDGPELTPDGGGGGAAVPVPPQNTVLPRSGPCNLVTPSFADLKSANAAAYNLLIATFGNNAAATYASWGTYNQAVFLNTIGAVAAQGVNLSNARFHGFYYGSNPDRTPFGVEVTGITTQDLDRAGLGSVPFFGRRSPRSIRQGSIEATVHGNIVAFDIDLWNPKSEFRRHQEEVRFNHRNQTATHPADVVRALNGRGVQTGVRCQ